MISNRWERNEKTKKVITRTGKGKGKFVDWLIGERGEKGWILLKKDALIVITWSEIDERGMEK